MKKSWFRSSIAGLLLGITLLSALYTGERLHLVPFIPFDLFDFVSRILPGWFITISIENMVKIIHLFNSGPTDIAAKQVEQFIAIVQFLLLTIAIGLGLSILLPRLPHHHTLLGAQCGALFFLGSITLEHSLGHPVSLLSAGVLLLLLTAWGIFLVLSIEWLKNPVPARTAAAHPDISRRKALLQLAGISLGTAFVIGIAGKMVRTQKMIQESWVEVPLDFVKPSTAALAFIKSMLPVSQRSGIEPAPGTRSEVTPRNQFYRIDIDAIAPVIDRHTWRLQLRGLFSRNYDLTFEDILSYPEVTQPATMCCISNPVGGDLISNGYFTGVRLRDLLQDRGIKQSSTALMVRAIDGYYESISHDDMFDSHTLLVYAINGYTLSARQGFPLRFFIPDRYGMKQPKWITSIEAVDHIDSGYWVDRGWDREARPQTLSIIDALTVDPEKKSVIAGGIAWAGNRGIKRVEVQVDKQKWEDAQLLTPPLSSLSWVLWRYDWKSVSGRHVFRVRATDGTGAVQIEKRQPPPPKGSTGYHEKSVVV